MSGQVAPQRSLSERLILWAIGIFGLWGIPSLILGWGAASSIEIEHQRLISEAFHQTELQLQDVAERSQVTTFFQNRLLAFEKQIRGTPFDTLKLRFHIEGLERDLPPGFMDLFLYDRDGVCRVFPRAASEAEALFDRIRRPWTEPLELYPTDSERFTSLTSTAHEIMRILKGRPRRVLALGGSRRATWGFFTNDPGQPAGCVGGILALFNQEALPRSFTLLHAIKQSDTGDHRIGFTLSDGTTVTPGHLSRQQARELARRFDLEASSRFSLPDTLVAVSRVDRNTLLIGTHPIPQPRRRRLGILVLGYLALSLVLLLPSWRRDILGQPLHFPLSRRIPGYFSLAFLLPLGAAVITSHLYLNERRVGLGEEHHRLVLNRLAEIDQGFEESVRRRILLYRNFVRHLQAHVEEPHEMQALFRTGYRNNAFDLPFLISSDSVNLLSIRSIPTTIRRALGKPRNERLDLLKSVTDRGMILNRTHIEFLTHSGAKPPEPWPEESSDTLSTSTVELERFELMMQKLLRQIGEEAIKVYDREHGFPAPFTDKLAKLAMESMFEAETRSFMRAARTCLGQAMPMEANNEYGLNYLDVIPGPDGRGWYFTFLFHHLSTLEHAYLERIFRSRPLRFEEGRLLAVTDYGIATNFPRGDEFRQFASLLGRLEGSRPIWRGRYRFDGQDEEIAALRGTYLKHYTLVALLNPDWVEGRLLQVKNRLMAWFFGLAIAGFLLAWILKQRFLQPVGNLSRGMKALSARQFEIELPVHSQDELGRLCRSFNHAVAAMREMALAQVVQADLLPTGPLRIGQWEIAGCNRMTESIGGDLYDYRLLPDGRVAILIGDVSGHGLSAALVAAMAKAGFGLLLSLFPEHPETVLGNMNTALLQLLNRTKMLTAFLFLFDPKTGSGICCNAGQSYPLVLESSGTSRYLKLPSNPLGIRAKCGFIPTPLSCGDQTLVFYSDGMIEASNERGTMFDYERFAITCSRGRHLAPAAFVEYLLKELRAFTGTVPWTDDVTLVILRRSV